MIYDSYLLETKYNWVWTSQVDACQGKYTKLSRLQQAICNSVHKDVSDFQLLGAVLISQEEGKPLTYYTQKLNSTQKN